MFYGYENYCLTLREERRLRILGNMLLEQAFERKGEMVTGHWWKLHTDELYDLYSTNVTRVITSREVFWMVHMTFVGEKRIVCEILVGKTEVRMPLGRPIHNWNTILKLILQK